MKSQRDEFLEILLDRAKKDSSIILLSVDMGALAIDRWKAELPDQYFEMGISEQNAINVAAGLSRGGKKVFVYFMAVWIHRCFEQIRYSSAIGNNKITILGNGVGLGYAPAGPAHEPNEDVAVMRTLHNFQIFAASSSLRMEGIVDQCLTSSVSNYVRLERKVHKSAQAIHEQESSNAYSNCYTFPSRDKSSKICILSYGQVVRRIYDLRFQYMDKFSEVSILELCKIWPLEMNEISDYLRTCSHLLVIEEQSRSGSISEALALELNSRQMDIKIKTIHLPSRYIFENGNQDELLDGIGFAKESILEEIDNVLNEKGLS